MINIDKLLAKAVHENSERVRALAHLNMIEEGFLHMLDEFPGSHPLLDNCQIHKAWLNLPAYQRTMSVDHIMCSWQRKDLAIRSGDGPLGSYNGSTPN